MRNGRISKNRNRSLWILLGKQRSALAVSCRQRVRYEQPGLIAAAISFYVMLAIVPGLLSLWSLVGMYVKPEAMESLVPTLLPDLPTRSADMLLTQLRAIAAHPPGTLTTGFWLSLLGMLWAASSGMDGLLRGLRRTVGLRSASFIRQRAMALGVTVALVVFVAFFLFLNLALPLVLRALELHDWHAVYVRYARWPILILLWLLGIESLFRVAFRKRVSMPTPGAVFALIAALSGSWAFTCYADRWGNWEATYGTLAGVVILLLWLYGLALALLLGATLNAELSNLAGERVLPNG